MKRFFYLLFWSLNPQGRREYEAGKARLVQLQFWAAECSRLYARFMVEPTTRTLRQYRVASNRYDMESTGRISHRTKTTK